MLRLAKAAKAYRGANNLSLRQAAKEIGIPASTYYRFEEGDDLQGPTWIKILFWFLKLDK